MLSPPPPGTHGYQDIRIQRDDRRGRGDEEREIGEREKEEEEEKEEEKEGGRGKREGQMESEMGCEDTKTYGYREMTEEKGEMRKEK